MPSLRSPFTLSATTIVVFTAIFLVLTGNHAFFVKMLEVYPWSVGNFGFLLSVSVGFTCVLIVLMTLLGSIVPVRVVASAFILITAMLGYFSDQFGAVIDTGMIQNILETDTAEAADLFNSGLILRVLFLGALPVFVLWRLPFSRAARGRELFRKIQAAGGAVAIIVICLFSFSDAYSGFFRLHKPLRYYSNPTFALYSAGRMLMSAGGVAESGPLILVAEDAAIPVTDTDRELIIMVVGETARADRFSLNGYGRETNPELAKEQGLVSYTNISACGTSTSVSVPCMFALDGYEEFDLRRAKNTENVLDVLTRAGVSVLWRDNNSGSKGVATRVVFEDFSHPDRNPVCDGECRDIGMLNGLQEFIDGTRGDILIVLHQMGNHGPAYFKRYPAEYERFVPACQYEELSRCTDEEIGNAYDNAILYTDHFLAQVIRLLQENTPQYETAMLYVSDHGESLGEKGLYLHGMPNMLAPDEQTEVPVIVWVGDTSDIELTSALDVRHVENSHDAAFHSLLSAFEVDTEVLSAKKTLFVINERG